MNQAYRDSMSYTVSQEYCRHIRYHHPKGRSSHNESETLELGSQSDRSDLGFIAHFG